VIAIAKVSVIVPVYNSEKYIGRCIKSILNQKLKELELIIVNDGSTDKSLDIIKKYASDHRIKIINMPNGGVSSARNAGIDAATGDYIGFVDADDWVHPEMYSSMYARITETGSDICLCNYIVEYPSRSIYMALSINKDVLAGDNFKKRLILSMIAPKDLNANSRTVMGSACRLLVKREFIKNNNIIFPLNIPLMEDLIFCIKAFVKCRQIAIDRGFYYHYFIDSASYYIKDLYTIHKNVYNIIEELVRENNLYGLAEPRLKIRYVNMCLSSISNEARILNRKGVKDKLTTIKNICRDKKLKQILNNITSGNLNIRKRMVLFALRHEMCIFLYIYHKLVVCKNNFKLFRIIA